MNTKTKYKSVSLRLSNDDYLYIKKYAELRKVPIARMVKDFTLERIEDECDKAAYDEAYSAYKKDHITIPFSEIIKKDE
jgi:hypothetical protein